MAERGYGPRHQQRRAELLAALAMWPGQPCPLCQAPMDVSQPLDLHHSNPAAKRAGQAGDTLAHAKCNRGEKSVPPQVRARQAASAEVPREPQCPHPRDYARQARPASGLAPCPYCGGYGSGRTDEAARSAAKKWAAAHGIRAGWA